jgi:hypothetical protein
VKGTPGVFSYWNCAEGSGCLKESPLHVAQPAPPVQPPHATEPSCGGAEPAGGVMGACGGRCVRAQAGGPTLTAPSTAAAAAAAAAVPTGRRAAASRAAACRGHHKRPRAGGRGGAGGQSRERILAPPHPPPRTPTSSLAPVLKRCWQTPSQNGSLRNWPVATSNQPEEASRVE